jgi:hypothetical protein
MFKFVETSDGSPSLRIGHEDGETESMHSLRGAFSETVYIYGTAIETCFQENFTPRILSVGLGLGYVEILAAALALKHGDQKQSGSQNSFGGESFELVPELRDYFKSWLFGAQGPAEDPRQAPQEFAVAYDLILSRTAEHTGIAAESIRECLKKALADGRWQLREALLPETGFPERFGCICFDAFSSKSTPDLWTEEFLLAFLDKAPAVECVLSTYACTGALKRSLKARDFEVSIREGFSSKRDSTFAVKRRPGR